MRTFLLVATLSGGQIENVHPGLRVFIDDGGAIPIQKTVVNVLNSSETILTLYADGRLAVKVLPPGEVTAVGFRNLSDWSIPVMLTAAEWDGQKFLREAEREFWIQPWRRQAEIWEITEEALRSLKPLRPKVASRTDLQVRTQLFGWRWNKNSIVVDNQTPYRLLVYRDGRPKLRLESGTVGYVDLLDLSGWGSSFGLIAKAYDEKGKVVGTATYSAYGSGYYQQSQIWTITKEVVEKRYYKPLTR